MRNSNMPRCGMPMCGKDSYRCDDYPIGMSYVPWQTFRELHEPEKALGVGTVFMELDKPFWGRRSFRR